MPKRCLSLVNFVSDCAVLEFLTPEADQTSYTAETIRSVWHAFFNHIC